MNKYEHALALYPYFGDSTAAMGIFPPTGLEYIVASIKNLVGKVTLLDLRHENGLPGSGNTQQVHQGQH